MQAIVDKIKNSGNKRISFKEFMEIALYDPVNGYYSKENRKIGKEGDFYTSSFVHPIFAEVFAHFFEMQLRDTNIAPYICEIGGGDGRFAKNILDTWKIKYPSSYEALKYIIIEKSPFHQKEIKDNLKEHTCYVLCPDLQTAKDMYPEFEGIIFSNELIDAFPVHLIEKRNGKLYEVFVELCSNQNLSEVLVPCQDKDIIQYLEDYGVKLDNAQRFEVPLHMLEWIEEISGWLNSGILVTIDYGYKNEEWGRPEHKDGSIRGYYKHQLISNPLQYPGEMDLTTHIHLDSFIKQGEQHLLKCLYENTQLEFLLNAGILTLLQEHYDPNPFSEVSKRNRAIRTFITPGGISSSFHVIIQGKGNIHLTWPEKPHLLFK